jgi:hypothetical protein
LVWGSITTWARPKNGFDGLSRPLRSLLRMASVGTVSVLVVSSRRRVHSSTYRKKSLLRSELNRRGMKTGPLRSKPNWLKRNGCGRLYRLGSVA